MANGQEKAVQLYIKNLAILSLKPRPGNSIFISEYFAGVAVPEYFNVFRGHHPLLHCLGSPEHIPADNHINLLAKSGKVGCLFTCSISSAYDCNCLLPVEKAVTCRAG